MHELPAAFVERIRKEFPDDAESMISSFHDEPKTSIHVRGNLKHVILEDAVQVPWFPNGKILKKRPVFTLDPLFHAGCYYPQESSSMFLHHILNSVFDRRDELRFLDLCAAPGGKSILMSEFLGRNGVLVSNEINKGRNHILKENLIKWGSSNVVVTSSDAKKFGSMGGFFDCVLVDAPCSGEGMFRKDLIARDEWSEQNVLMCSDRQALILSEVASAVKQGGFLIYSTCTFAKQENELQCRKLIESGDWESIEIPVDPSWKIHSIVEDGFYAYQFLPHLIPGEGFFVSVFRKLAPADVKVGRPGKVFSPVATAQKKLLGEWMQTSDALIHSPDGLIYNSPLDADELNFLANEVYLTQPGTPVGKILRDELIPEHALALYSHLSESIQRIDCTEEDSLKFLRGETFPLDASPGWAVITHKTHPLGWVKVMKNRFNNYFPKEYRIRMR